MSAINFCSFQLISIVTAVKLCLDKYPLPTDTFSFKKAPSLPPGVNVGSELTL